MTTYRTLAANWDGPSPLPWDQATTDERPTDINGPDRLPEGEDLNAQADDWYSYLEETR